MILARKLPCAPARTSFSLPGLLYVQDRVRALGACNLHEHRQGTGTADQSTVLARVGAVGHTANIHEPLVLAPSVVHRDALCAYARRPLSGPQAGHKAWPCRAFTSGLDGRYICRIWPLLIRATPSIHAMWDAAHMRYHHTLEHAQRHTAAADAPISCMPGLAVTHILTKSSM